MENTEIGFKHTYMSNNGYADYTNIEEIIGIFYKAGLGSTNVYDSKWTNIDEVKESLDKFYQILRQTHSKNTSGISMVVLSEKEWLEQFKKNKICMFQNVFKQI
jgi:hypothetical protein